MVKSDWERFKQNEYFFDKKQAAMLPNPPPYDIISEPTVSVYSTIGSEEQQRIVDFVKLSDFTENIADLIGFYGKNLWKIHFKDYSQYADLSAGAPKP